MGPGTTDGRRRAFRRVRFLWGAALLFWFHFLALGNEAAVPAGTSHPSDLVLFARPARIDGQVEGSLAAVAAPVTLSGTVNRDVIVFGADAVIEGPAQVGGDVLVVGGSIHFVSGATPGAVRGRILTLSALETAFLTELETSPLGVSAAPALLTALRLILLTGWLAAALALLLLRPRWIFRAADSLGKRLAVIVLAGLLCVLSALLLASACFLLAPGVPGLLVALLLGSLLFAAKVFGLAAVFLAVGRLLVGRARRGSLFFGEPAAMAAGLLALGILSLVPAAGPFIWGVASVAGIGVTVFLMFASHPRGI